MEADIIISSAKSSLPYELLIAYRMLETPHTPMLIYLIRNKHDNRRNIPNMVYIDVDHPEDFDNIKKKRIRDHIEAIRLRIRSGNNKLETN